MKRTTCVRVARPGTKTVRTLICCTAIIATPLTAGAEIFSVPVQYPTIQEAVAVAQDGDTIFVAPGTYDGPVRFHGKKITIRALGSPGSALIHAVGSAVLFIDGETLDSSLEGFEVSGSGATFGGGIHISDSSATIRDCSVTGTALVRGGGISVQWGEADIINTYFAGASTTGGGLAVYHANVRLDRCDGEGIANVGGGIAVIDSSLEYSDGEILNGESFFDGGGIYILRSSLDLRDVRVADCEAGGANPANARGGGVCILDSPPPTILRCRVQGNKVVAGELAHGGGIYSDGPLVLESLTCLSNQALSGGEKTDGFAAGGGVYSDSGSCTLAGCLFIGNKAETTAEMEQPDGVASGGSIKVSDDVLILKSTFCDPIYLINGGEASASKQVRGGCIEAGTGNVVMHGTLISDAQAVVFEETESFVTGPAASASGGAIWTEAHATLSLSQVYASVASGAPSCAGGGIYAAGGVELTDSSVSRNLANGAGVAGLGGGGIYAGTSSVTVDSCQLLSNGSVASGGGIHGGTISLLDSTISNCITVEQGGGLFGKTIEIDNCTLNSNSAIGGGAVFSVESIVVRNTTMIANVAGLGPTTDLVGGGAIHSLGDTLIEDVIGHSNRVYGTSGQSGIGRGGFLWSESSPTVRYCEFDGNLAASDEFAYGAAIGSASAIDVEGCTFQKNLVRGNSSDFLGENAGSSVHAPSGSIEECTFYLNQAFGTIASGGAIAVTGTPGITIRNCAFHRDMAVGGTARGGSVFSGGGSTQILDCSFLECSSSQDGGALSLVEMTDESNLVISGSTFTSNLAETDGGAVSTSGVGNVDIRNSVFQENIAVGNGGGLDLHVRTEVLSNRMIEECIFDGNSATLGGGLYLSANNDDVVHLSSSVLSGNSASVGGGAYVDIDVLLRCQEDTFCGNDPDEISGDWADIGGNSFGAGSDCNENGTCDAADIALGTSFDCNANGLPDDCDITSGSSIDADGDGVPDECTDDCNANGVSDQSEIDSGAAEDCNLNGIPDECDIAEESSTDYDGNGVPDECDPDCNENGLPDELDIATGTSEDCNENLEPDECDIAEGGSSSDQDANGVPDECECLGELDGNGFIDTADITILLGEWGPAEVGEPADLNVDGEVDGEDLFVLLANYGDC